MPVSISSSAKLSGLRGFTTAMQIQRGLLRKEGDGERTPLFDGEDPRDILARWQKIVSLEKVSDPVAELEKAETKKFGPYYHRPFGEWESNLRNYFVHEPVEFDLTYPDDARLMAGVETVLSEINISTRNKLKPLDIESVYERSRKGTNYGFPDVSSDPRRIDLGSYIRRAQRLALGKDETLYPFILFRRVQPGGWDRKDAKQRPVWGSDHAETLAGLSILYPLLDRLKSVPGFEHLVGVDALENRIVSLRSRGLNISGDFSQCDATFGPRLVLIGLRMIHDCVECEEGLLRQLYQYYTQGEILTPIGIMSGVHGLPSGIALTNLLETLVLRAIGYASLLTHGMKGKVFGNGDDILVFLEQEYEQAGKFGDLYKEYGLKWNDAKSAIRSGAADYLQRHFYSEEDYRAIMSTTRMLNRIVFAERINQSAVKSIGVQNFWTLNTIVKLENCKRHPIFEKFVDFVRSGDRYGLDPKDILSVDITRILGYDPFGDSSSDADHKVESGLLNFDTVKYLVANRR